MQYRSFLGLTGWLGSACGNAHNKLAHSARVTESVTHEKIGKGSLLHLAKEIQLNKQFVSLVFIVFQYEMDVLVLD